MSSLTILDTNVISELSRANPDASVKVWYLRQQSALLYTTTITVAEVYYGLDLLPAGQRRQLLYQLSTDLFDQEFADRILSFNYIAARLYAGVRADAKRRGRPMSPLDAQIAAVALAANATLATRNTADFEQCGIRLINPWLP